MHQYCSTYTLIFFINPLPTYIVHFDFFTNPASIYTLTFLSIALPFLHLLLLLLHQSDNSVSNDNFDFFLDVTYNDKMIFLNK